MALQSLDRPDRAGVLTGGAAITAAFAVLLYLGNAGIVTMFSGAAYEENQHTYVLHGLAQTGLDRLAADWMAGTVDPFPLFSGFVAIVQQLALPAAFALLYFLLVLLFVRAMGGLYDELKPAAAAPGWRALFLAIVVLPYGLVMHMIPEPLAARLVAISNGVAGQYVLGGYLQPSELGILLIAAVALQAQRRPLAAIAAAGLPCIVNPSYLLASAFFAAGICAWAIFERRWRTAGLAGPLWLALALPPSAVALSRFAPSSAEAYATAGQFLVHARIPHHALPQFWAGPETLLAGLALVTALVMWRDRRHLVLPLAVAMALTLTGSLAVWLVDRPALYLMFPWRASVYLVPVAFGLLAMRLIAALMHVTRLDAPQANRAAAILFSLLLVLSLFGRARMPQAYDPATAFGTSSYSEYLDPAYEELVNWARERAPDDALFAVPILPRGLESFRIRAGRPVFVDFKTHPYKDVEVLEWRRRVAIVRSVYTGVGNCDAALLAPLLSEGVTHILVGKELIGAATLRASPCLAGPSPVLAVAFENRRFLMLAVEPALRTSPPAPAIPSSPATPAG